MKLLYLMWRNLTRKPIRTFLTIASVFVAFVLFGVLIAVRTALGAGVELAGVDRMIMIHKVSLIQMLPESYGNKIMADDGVASITHSTWFGGTYVDPKNFFPRVAIDSDTYFEVHPEYEIPAEEMEAWQRNRTGALIGRTIAEKYDLKVGDRIPIQGDIWQTQDGSAWEFTIEGIFDGDKNVDKNQMFFHHKYLTENSGMDGMVGWYSIRVKDPEQSPAIAERLDARFANSPAETKTSTEKAFVQGFANQIGDIGRIALFVSIVVFFTLLLVSGNTVAQSVRERTNELGVLKTLGFSDGQMMAMVLGESFLITILGGGLGLGLVVVVTNFFDLTTSTFPTLYMPWKDVGIGAVLLLVMGFLAGALPAFKALNLTIVDALRRS